MGVFIFLYIYIRNLVVNPLVFSETFELKIKPSTNKGLNKQTKTRQLCTTLQTRGLL
jgi:hypothetical protein